MIHTRTAVMSSKLATVTNAKMHLHCSVVQEEEGNGVFHQLIDFPWLPGNSLQPIQLRCPGVAVSSSH